MVAHRVLLMSATLVCTVAFVNTASSIEKKPPPATATKAMAPLTETECQGLGGKVRASATCSTGEKCVTVDRDGVIHGACISKK